MTGSPVFDLSPRTESDRAVAFAIMLCGPTLSLKSTVAGYLARRARVPVIAASTLHRYGPPDPPTVVGPAKPIASADRDAPEIEARVIDSASRERRRALVIDILRTHVRLGVSVLLDDGFNRRERREEVYAALRGKFAGPVRDESPATAAEVKLNVAAAYRLWIVECTCTDPAIRKARNDVRRADPLATEDAFTDSWVAQLHDQFQPVTEDEVARTGLLGVSLTRFDSAQRTFPRPDRERLDPAFYPLALDLHRALAAGLV